MQILTCWLFTLSKTAFTTVMQVYFVCLWIARYTYCTIADTNYCNFYYHFPLTIPSFTTQKFCWCTCKYGKGFLSAFKDCLKSHRARRNNGHLACMFVAN